MMTVCPKGKRNIRGLAHVSLMVSTDRRGARVPARAASDFIFQSEPVSLGFLLGNRCVKTGIGISRRDFC